MGFVRAARLRTVRQAAEELTAFSESSLRWLLYSDADFRRTVAVEVNRRHVLIDLDALDRWLTDKKAQTLVQSQQSSRKARTRKRTVVSRSRV